jgi:hypothetical protein
MAMTKLRRPVSGYLRDNVHYTFSGFNFPATFLDLLLAYGKLFQKGPRLRHGLVWMVGGEHDPNLGVSTAADKERIAHGNAERLLRL